MKTKTRKLIGLISRPMERLEHRDWNGNDIRCDIAVLEEGVNSPRNWRHDWEEPKTSTGGCFARIFASKDYPDSPSRGLFSYCGPEINYGTQGEYEHGARAMKTIAKRLDAMYQIRGNAKDSADEMGRFLEAAGVTEVWVCTKAGRSMLNEMQWQTLAIGRAVLEIRERLPETPKPEAAEQIAS